MTAQGPGDRLLGAAAWLLLIGLVACVVVGTSNAFLDVEGFEFPKELVLGAVAFLAATLALVASRTAKLGLRDTGLFAFAALAPVSALVAAGNPWMAWRAVALSAAGVAIYFTARTIARRGRQGSLLAVVAIVVVLVGLAMLLESYGILPSLSLAKRAPAATLGHRNYAAHFLALGLPLLILHALARPSRRALGLAAVGVAIVTAAMVLTRCRTAWIAGFALSVLVPALLAACKDVAWRSWARPIGMLGLAAVVGVALATLLPNKLKWADATGKTGTLGRIIETDRGTGRGRVLQYGHTVDMIRHTPFLGVGPGNWFFVYPSYVPPDDPTLQPGDLFETPAHATSDLTGLTAERGVLAMLALLGFFAITGIAAARALRRAPTLAAATAPLAVMLMLAALAVCGALDCVLQLPLPTFFVFLMLGTLETDGAPDPSSDSLTLRLPAPARVGGAVLLVAIGVAVTAMNVRQTRACVLATRARTATDWDAVAATGLGQYRPFVRAAIAWHTERHCNRLLTQANAALRLNPGSSLAMRVRASCVP